MTEAKAVEGMGVKDFKLLNQVLLEKQCWRLIHQLESFCAKFMKTIYFPNEDLMKAKHRTRPSWVWSSLLHGRELLEKGLMWQVGDGSDISFWEDKWISLLPN